MNDLNNTSYMSSLAEESKESPSHDIHAPKPESHEKHDHSNAPDDEIDFEEHSYAHSGKSDEYSLRKLNKRKWYNCSIDDAYLCIG